MHPLDRLDKIRNTSPLGAGLENALGLMDGIRKLLAGFDSDAARFLAVDIFNGLGGHDRGGRMPAISCGDQDSVDVFAIEQLAKVRVQFAILVSIETIDELFARIATGCLDIGDRHASHVRKWEHGFDIVGATRTDADDPELNSIIGAFRCV